MYILITIFYIALLGIISMILIKRAEMKHNDIGNEDRAQSKIETRLSELYARIVVLFKMFNKRTVIALAQFMTFHVLYRTRNVYVELKHRTLQNPHGKRMIDAIRGRGEVKNHGASFYLRRISDR